MFPQVMTKKVLKLKKTKVCQNPNWKKEKFAWSYKLELGKQKTTFRFTNSKLKNKKINFKLLTQNWKIKSFFSSYKLES